MAVSKKQQASVNKYIKEHYDNYRLTFPKGRKAEIQTHAETKSESLNKFINRAIDETIERDNDGVEDK
jgi:predicted HicB family RNase H-like nuclease